MEESIDRQIIDLLNTANEDAMKEDVFELSFTFNGKPYQTIFKASHGKSGYGLDNRCVTIWYEEHIPGTGKLFDTSIRANAIELQPCFTPQLVSYRKNKNPSKITSADVLQTLKTKLSLLLFRADSESAGAAAGGGGSAEAAAAADARRQMVQLSDIAEKDGISISKFNLLRGRDAFYEKYGYVSPLLNEFKSLYKNFTFDEFFTKIYMKRPPMESWLRITNLIPQYTKKLNGTESFMTIMNEISWDMEKGEIGEDTVSISTDIFNIVSRYLLGKEGKTVSNDILFRFTLNPESAAWQKYNSMLVFTGIDIPPPAEGGRRRKRRRTVRKSNCKGKRTPSRK
jgi:hypothetical protein